MWGHSLNLDTSSLNHEVSDKNACKKVALGCPRAVPCLEFMRLDKLGHDDWKAFQPPHSLIVFCIYQDFPLDP